MSGASLSGVPDAEGPGRDPGVLRSQITTEAQGGTARRVARAMARQPLTVIALSFLLVLALAAAIAPLIAPHDPKAVDFDQILAGPSGAHLLGTDDLGRDVLSRLLFGARVALEVALGSVAIAILLGVPIGLLIGYRGRWTDRLGTRFLDVLESLPGLIIAFAVITILGRSLSTTIIAIGLIFTVRFARLTRAVTLSEREQLYVEAARVAGLSTPNILFRQILPNLAGPLIVLAAVCLGLAILIESLISFIGLGLDVSEPSWGGMLTVATDVQARQPLLPFPPGVAIVLTVLAFNVVGDGLREALSGERRLRAGVRRARRQAAPAELHRPTLLEALAPRDARVPEGLLTLRGVTVELPAPDGEPVTVIEDVDLSVRGGEVMGLVGESGCGKSMLARTIMGLLPPGGHLVRGSIRLNDRELAGLGERDLQGVRGPEMSMVFQDPLLALSPVHTVATQLSEPLRTHRGLTKQAAREEAAELLARVGVPEPRSRLDDYPHQFSGGMAQRVAIAMALSCRPKILIADEATTALDVTTQSQVLDLLLELQSEFEMAILLITHDLGVVAEVCDRAAVMYAGEVVEIDSADALLEHPHHPYTAALLAANPGRGRTNGRLPTIPGRVPHLGEWPTGCRFAPRCAYATDACVAARVPIVGGVRCVRADELATELEPAAGK
jgi:oligopeptide/dipeptide ABC transporter ATP-binding protein